MLSSCAGRPANQSVLSVHTEMTHTTCEGRSPLWTADNNSRDVQKEQDGELLPAARTLSLAGSSPAQSSRESSVLTADQMQFISHSLLIVDTLSLRDLAA